MPTMLAMSSVDEPQALTSSSAEASPTWNMHEVAYQMKCLGIQDVEHQVSARPFGASSDSGASSGDNSLEHALPPLVQAPGSWFYEVPDVTRADLNSVSPLNAPFNAILGRVSKNVTENVQVPSSEHVAEIVGRQGCKIKALRAKTNTYIKTPVRGDQPVFVVTGRPDDVLMAKKEIECAADHFTQIRASRRHSQGVRSEPGHITAYVRVPYRVVGLVVGPKGATIKRIQQETHTYIITPSREREPIFEVTGMPPNVDAARREIENHIFQRTGNMPITDSSGNPVSYPVDAQRSMYGAAAHSTPRRGSADDVNDFHSNGNDVSFSGTMHGVGTAISKPHSLGNSPPPQMLTYGAMSAPDGTYPIWSGMQQDANNCFYQPPNPMEQYVSPSQSFGVGGAISSDLTDEGLGESPSRGLENNFAWSRAQEQPLLPQHLMSSIWSVLDNADAPTGNE